MLKTFEKQELFQGRHIHVAFLESGNFKVTELNREEWKFRQKKRNILQKKCILQN